MHLGENPFESGMEMKGKALLRLLLVLSFFAFAGVSAAKTIYVPEDYPTIQQAVNNASAGDTIIVRDGVYTENMDVNVNNLTIRSENGSASTIVQAKSSNDHVFEVQADYVNISGFTVTGATEPGKSGISLFRVNHCNVSNNHGKLNNLSISLWSSDTNIITGNAVSDNWIGVYLKNSSNNTIIDNSATSDSWHGIELWNSTNNAISNNSVSLTDKWAGISLSYSCNNTIFCYSQPDATHIGILFQNTIVNSSTSFHSLSPCNPHVHNPFTLHSR